MAERDAYQRKLDHLWQKSRNGTLTSSDSIWQELRSKTNLRELQRELDQMRVR